MPDLSASRTRFYLDASGLVQHREGNEGIADLMRYAALNQEVDDLGSFAGFIPAAEDFKTRPPAASQTRYSDEQLYALARYIYSLRPPENPNKFDERAARGKGVFGRKECRHCHTPPLYTNNKLMPVEGFEVPEEHRRRYRIMDEAIDTDPGLTLNTRRGTGYYKVPSLRGVWYRSMFGHGGSCATLEDWFDPRRLRDDYVPTGFRGYKVERGPCRGTSSGSTWTTETGGADRVPQDAVEPPGYLERFTLALHTAPEREELPTPAQCSRRRPRAPFRRRFGLVRHSLPKCVSCKRECLKAYLCSNLGGTLPSDSASAP